ncbi:MAG: dihydrofolate reductase family protein [Nocardioidaceae bacterium]
MRKVVESTFVTLDGVISDPQDWGPPYWDDEHNEYAGELLFASDALLLGRETYEGFAEAWQQRSGDPYTDRINAMPKHVASRTLTETSWNASLLAGDAAEEVAQLKQQEGLNLLKFGTGELSRTLLASRLVDEYHFWVFPVIAGKGDRLFDGFDLTHLDLVRTTPFTSGIVVHAYAPK